MRFHFLFSLLLFGLSSQAIASGPCERFYALVSGETKESEALDEQLAKYASENKGLAELWSIRHQRDVLGAADDPVLTQRLGLSAEELASERQGILDSDKGKLAEYKRYMNPIAPENTALLHDSNLLLDVLSGKPGAQAAKSQAAFRDLLDQAGYRGKWMLGPNITNDEIRNAFREIPALNGYLHELPGMLDAIKAYEAGSLTKKQFQDRLRANLFHNGPAKGFWGFLQDTLVGGGLSKAGISESTKKLFSGTVFLNAEGKLAYPAVLSRLDAHHLILDRLSQGTGGGMIKMYQEIIPFTPPVKAVKDMIFGNPQLTIEQLDQVVLDVAKLGDATPEGRTALTEAAKVAKMRVEQFQKELEKRVVDVGEGKIYIDGQIYEVTADPAKAKDAFAAQKKALYDAYEKVVTDTEAKMQPMRPLSLGQ